tara:strand:+ start:3054 stop:3437 length:384 start_codon:yes stop_codon:yes gene_type:complete
MTHARKSKMTFFRNTTHALRKLTRAFASALQALFSSEPAIPLNCWVIILADPDDGYWSPWSVRANSYNEAVRIAIDDWWEWVVGDEHINNITNCDCERCLTPNPYNIQPLKVYRGSWIGKRMDSNSC